MPGPYGLPQMGCAREGRGRAAARPFSRAEVARERVVTQSPSESPRPLTRPAPFDKGAFFCAGEAREGSLPIRGGGREAGRKGSGSWRVAAR